MQASLLANIHWAAIDIRKAIQRTENKMSWPPRPSDLSESAMNIPKELDLFLQTLMTGKKQWPDECEKNSGQMRTVIQEYSYFDNEVQRSNLVTVQRLAKMAVVCILAPV